MFVSVVAYTQTVTETTSKTTKESYVNSSNNKVDSHTSVSQSDHYYKLNADFNVSKSKAVLQLLTKHLGTSTVKKGGNMHTWMKQKDGEVFFTCEFSDGKVYFNVNTIIASSQEEKELKALGKEVRLLITKHQNQNGNYEDNWRSQAVDPQLKKQQTRLEAERELARAKRNLERIKKEQKKKE